MEREEVRKLLSGIFEVVLNQPVQLTDKMTPDDIDNWDSLTNMTIISEIESQWGIKFKLRDIIRLLSTIIYHNDHHTYYGISVDTICMLHGGDFSAVLSSAESLLAACGAARGEHGVHWLLPSRLSAHCLGNHCLHISLGTSHPQNIG